MTTETHDEQRSYPARRPYGQGDNTFSSAGGEPGIRALVDLFYDRMALDYKEILDLHPPDNEQSRDKLARFLCGWTGGPKRYSEKYGSITIPGVHAHLPIDGSLRDQWLQCMAEALAQMPYADDLRMYLAEQLAVPAERIRQACERNR